MKECPEEKGSGKNRKINLKTISLKEEILECIKTINFILNNDG